MGGLWLELRRRAVRREHLLLRASHHADHLALPNDASATPEQAVVFDLAENEIIHTSVTVGDFDEACTECALESYQGFWTMSPESCCTGTNDVVLAEMEPSLAEMEETAVEDVSWGQIKAAH